MDEWVQRLLAPPTGAEALASLRALSGEPASGVQHLRLAMRWMDDVDTRAEAREQLRQLTDRGWATIGVSLERLAPAEIDRFVDTITPWLTARELGLVFTSAGDATRQELVDAVAEHGTPAVQREFARLAQRELIASDTEVGLGLTEAEREQMLDLAQMALDLAGIVDPTGLADGGNALISLLRGNWFDAGVSAVSMLPVLGDMAKLGKLGDWAQTTHEVVARAARDSEFYRKVEPALTKLGELIDAIPAGALRGELKSQIENIAAALDSISNPDVENPDVHRSARGTEAPNAAINARPAERIPNHTYNVDDRAFYTTDARGRVVAMDAIITEETIADRPRRRDYSQQTTVAADGYVGFDEGGHLLSHANGGAGERINIVPLGGAINRGPGSRWTEMERMIQDEARAGRTVEMKMVLEYGSDAMPNRPTNIYVDVYIDGVKVDVPYEFDNLEP